MTSPSKAHLKFRGCRSRSQFAELQAWGRTGRAAVRAFHLSLSQFTLKTEAVPAFPHLLELGLRNPSHDTRKSVRKAPPLEQFYLGHEHLCLGTLHTLWSLAALYSLESSLATYALAI